MAKPRSWRLTGYDGGFRAHPEPEEKGSLILHPGGRWELRFPRGFGREDRWVKAGVERHPIVVEESSGGSCRVTIGDSRDSTHRASFDLGAPAAELQAALASQADSIAAVKERDEHVSSGAWWLAPKAFQAFGGFGVTQRLRVGESRYLGGWSGYGKTHTAKNMNNYVEMDRRGISYTVWKTVFTIPWEHVLDVQVEGPAAAARRVTAGRLLAVGVFALAAQTPEKMAVVIVQLRSGEEAIFDTKNFTAPELRGKLAPVTSQLRRANATRVEAEAHQRTGAPAASIADELKKLGELKAAGLLTDEEFAGQKARLLG